jgi:hypothetical protein
LRSRTSRAFRKNLASLPASAKRRAAEAYRQFIVDPDHRGIEFKRVRVPGNIYSARVGLAYRALGQREGDLVVWFWIGTHAEYDHLLRQFRRG